MKSLGMVLEGGGQRGVFTSGVLDYLLEVQFKTEYMIGVSAGACNMASFISNQPKRTKRCMIDAHQTHKMVSVTNVLKRKYIFDMELIFDKFPNEIYPFDYQTYFSSPIKGVYTMTDCQTGEPVYLSENEQKERLMALCQASSSLPFLAPMVKVDDHLLFDGGIANSIPVDQAIKDGYDYNIVILTKPQGYLKKPGKSKSVFWMKRAYKKYPKLIKAIEKRNDHYNQTLEELKQLEKEKKVFIIQPDFDGTSRGDQNIERLNKVYNHGYDKMKKIYPQLEQWIKEIGK